jgi:hypothetical protein
LTSFAVVKRFTGMPKPTPPPVEEPVPANAAAAEGDAAAASEEGAVAAHAPAVTVVMVTHAKQRAKSLIQFIDDHGYGSATLESKMGAAQSRDI